MDVIGRVDEKKILLSLLEEESSKFLAIYGRRRIGKTFLIRNTYEKQIIFECTGLQNGSLADQLDNFCLCLINSNFSFAVRPQTWLQAFSLLSNSLNKLRSNKKKVLFFDEIPWMDSPRSGFLAAFANFWNSYCTKKTDIIVVICGSATSWVINKIVKSKGGLHNRLNRTIRLEPFTLWETKQFLAYKRIHLSNKDLALLYMCIGGIPFYLNEVKPGMSIPQIIDDLFLSKNAILKFEFQYLYEALFSNFEKHKKVISALNEKNKGLTRQEIVDATNLESSGTLTIVLDELEACGFIQKLVPIDKQKVDNLYRLMDEYSLFYFKFLNRNDIKLTGQTLVNSQSFKIWARYAFESLCLRHQSQIVNALGFSGVAYGVYSFVTKANEAIGLNKGAQIDLIFERADNVVNLIEAKFYDTTYVMTQSDADTLLYKKQAYQTKTKSKKTIFTTLITMNGADRNKHFLGTITNELTFDDLMG